MSDVLPTGLLAARPATANLTVGYFGASTGACACRTESDALIRRLAPLERTGLWERGEVPETFPSAL